MKLGDLDEVIVCFRCGEISPEYTLDKEKELLTCNSCGDNGVVTIPLLIDIVNDMFLKGIFVPNSVALFEDNTMDYDYYLNIYKEDIEDERRQADKGS